MVKIVYCEFVIVITIDILVDVEMNHNFNQFRGFKQPCHKLEVVYDEDTKVELGTILEISDVSSAPAIKYSKADDDNQFEVVLIDYDNWINDKENWLLWHLTSISSENIKEGNIDEATVQKEYKSGKV